MKSKLKELKELLQAYRQAGTVPSRNDMRRIINIVDELVAERDAETAIAADAVSNHVINNHKAAIYLPVVGPDQVLTLDIVGDISHLRVEPRENAAKRDATEYAERMKFEGIADAAELKMSASITADEDSDLVEPSESADPIVVLVQTQFNSLVGHLVKVVEDCVNQAFCGQPVHRDSYRGRIKAVLRAEMGE